MRKFELTTKTLVDAHVKAENIQAHIAELLSRRCDIELTYENGCYNIYANIGFGDAVEYVRQALNMEEIQHAKETLSFKELIYYSEALTDEIHDLMEEYGDKYNLPEGWWYDEVSITDDIFWKL